jgi:hypothetical protein
MREYHAIFPTMYAVPQNVTIQHAYDMWTKFGISEELANKVKTKTEAFATVPTIMLGVSKLYDAMLVEAKNLLKKE